MVSNGFDQQVGLVPRLIYLFAPGYARDRMIVKALNSEIPEQPPLSIMQVQNFTEPVYQKFGRIRALNFNPYVFTWLDGIRINNQMSQRPGGVLKRFLGRGPEGFKTHVCCVLKKPAGVKPRGTRSAQAFIIPKTQTPE
jgi:hypothetical protein